MLNEAKTSRPKPELRGRGQFLEVEAKAEAKNNYEKSAKPTNNIRFKIIARKINKIPNFTRFLPEKCPITQ